MHLAIAITMTPTLITYSLIMVVGYLAFFDGNLFSSQSKVRTDVSSKTAFKLNVIELGLGLAFIAIVFMIPSRTFFWFKKRTRHYNYGR